MQKGFTLIEIFVVLFILGVISVFSASYYFQFLDAQKLGEASESTLSFFDKAKALTLASRGTGGGALYGIHFHDRGAGNEILIIKGTDDSGTALVVDRYVVPKGIELIPVSAPVNFPPAEGGHTSIFFDRLTGDISVQKNDGSLVPLSPSGFITLQSARFGTQKVISFSPKGIVTAQ